MVSQGIRRKRVMKFCVIPFLENAFERLGRIIARWPYLVILLCLLCTGICSIGLLNLRLDADIYSIWNTNPDENPEGSQTVVNKILVSNNFSDNTRFHTLLFTTTEPDGNILTPTAFQTMLNVHNAISTTLGNVTFQDICYR